MNNPKTTASESPSSSNGYEPARTGPSTADQTGGDEEGNKTQSNEEKPNLANFDLAKLRLSQDFAANVGVKKALLTVPVRKPGRQWFIRVHPGEDYRLQTAVLELEEDRETYLVDSSLWSELPGEIVPMQLHTAINRQGVVFLWPVRLPRDDGRQMEWHRSALEAAEMATKMWVSVRSNMSLGAYEVFEATGNLPDPEWPDKPFEGLLEIAFRNRFIKGFDHSALKRLRGEA